MVALSESTDKVTVNLQGSCVGKLQAKFAPFGVVGLVI